MCVRVCVRVHACSAYIFQVICMALILYLMFQYLESFEASQMQTQFKLHFKNVILFLSWLWFWKWRSLPVVLVLVDVVESAWRLPLHHKWHNLADTATARGSRTQGDRSWEITLLRTVDIWLVHEHADQNTTHSPWLPSLCTGDCPLLL